MRALLTGSDGQVGWELERLLRTRMELVATDRRALDLADPGAVAAKVREVRPDLILNAAAYTQVDRAESEQELAMAVNARAPGIFAEEARRTGALLIHFSTDYVFDGESDRPYREDDPTGPASAYGRSKLAGEQAVLGSGCRCLVLRTSWVYAPRGRNFFLTIARKALEGVPLRVVDDQVGVPTSAAYVALATSRAIEAMQSGRDMRACYHVVADGSTSWYGFARAIVRRVAPEVTVAPISSADYPQVARRPRWSILDNRRARADFGLPEMPWEKLLDDCVAASRLP